MLHCDYSGQLIRPPGTPPATCRGEIYRVDGGGTRIDDRAPPVLDTCLPGEGELRQSSEVYLWCCAKCRTTIVDAVAPDGTHYQRNSWSPAAWDRTASRAEDEPALAVVA